MGVQGSAACVALLSLCLTSGGLRAADWIIAGTVLTPSGIVVDGAVSISDKTIKAVGPSATIPGAANVPKMPGIILPGFIDLHNHLSWNVLPRWVPVRKFGNRYEWQDSPEYDRILVAPHNAVMDAAGCETEIFAEIKAMAGGATSVLGSPAKDQQHPENVKCVSGLARELYGSTANIASARLAGVDIAIAPDWSPTGGAGMLQEMGYAARHYGISSGDLIAMATSVPAQMARIADYIGSLAPNKFADFVVINVKVDVNKPNPLDPVVKAGPADVALVVVGGQPLYGDSQLLDQVLPAGTRTDKLMVCGVEKAIYLGQSEAASHGWSITQIQSAISTALAKAGSSLGTIECD
jgi:hypothetical protein